MISIGSLYHLIPRLYGKERMYSTDLINVHFWMSTIGTVLYIAALWVNGIMQGLMWRAYNQDGTLTYAFVESVGRELSGLDRPGARWRDLPQRHADHGLQRLHDYAQGRPGAGTGGRRSVSA
jgi:hypothetical protein